LIFVFSDSTHWLTQVFAHSQTPQFTLSFTGELACMIMLLVEARSPGLIWATLAQFFKARITSQVGILEYVVCPKTEWENGEK
jgi:hypothetical protein